MEMDIHEKDKLVAIYLTKAEKTDPLVRAGLQDIFAKYKGTKYLVSVFESGEKDLRQSTLDLLAYNKKRMAEKEARRQWEEIPESERPSALEMLRRPEDRSRAHKQMEMPL